MMPGGLNTSEGLRGAEVRVTIAGSGNAERLEAAVDLARDLLAALPSSSIFEANVACGQPSSSASIWPGGSSSRRRWLACP